MCALQNATTNLSGSAGAAGLTIGAVLRRQWPVMAGVLAIVVLGTAAYLAITPKRYTAVARVSVEKLNTNLITQTNQETGGGGAENTFLNTQAQIIRSTPILAIAAQMPGADDLAIFEGVDNRIKFLHDNLRVEVGSKDELITISLESPHADDAEKLVSAIIEGYRAYDSKQRREAAAGLLNVLTDQKTTLESDIAKKNADLFDFRHDNQGFAMEGDRGNLAIQQLERLATALSDARVETINARTRFEDLCRAAGFTPEQVMNMAGHAEPAMTDEGEFALRQEINRLRGTIEELRLNYLPEHPTLVRLESRLRQLQFTQTMSALSRWRSSERRVEELQKSYDTQQAVALRQQAGAARFAQIQSEIKRLESQLDTLSSQMRELQLAVSAGALLIQVRDEASTAFTAPSPRPARTMGLALAAGVALAIGVALLREWADPRLRGADEAEAVLGTPVLGAIPHVSGRPTPVSLAWAAYSELGSPVGEAFRALRHSLALGADNARSLAVVSPASGDGRSVLASNIAIALAEAGRRVLLIDGNFRSPALHAIFDLPPDGGFASVLSAEMTLEEAVRKSALPTLSVLVAGQAVDGGALLNQGTFAEMLDSAARQYDITIIDTPAASAGPEARLIAANCQATVMLVRANKTNRFHALRTRDGLWNVAANVAGVVVNDAPGSAMPPARPPTTGRSMSDRKSDVQQNDKLTPVTSVIG